MRFKTSLRFRVASAFALLGAVVAIGMAAALYVQTGRIESRLLAETLDAELGEFMRRYALDPATATLSSASLQTYAITDPAAEDVPRVLRHLRSGLHEVALEGGRYYAEVREREGVRFVVVYADDQLRHRRQEVALLLSVGVLGMIALAAALGLWLAGRVIAPVTDLAKLVHRLAPEEYRPGFSARFADDEVGELARVFDAYLERLASFIDRERNFTADVSHELRTPLAVIKGAAEVLIGDPNLSEAGLRRVERIQRVANDATELTTALLTVARERSGAERVQGSCRVEEALSQVLDAHRYLLQNRPISLDVDVRGAPQLPVDCALFKVVVGNLVRNSLAHTEQGTVRIVVDADALTVVDTGAGIAQSELTRVFDRYYRTGRSNGEGIGLALVQRICNSLGWGIELSSEEGEGTEIRLAFHPADVPAVPGSAHS